MPIRTASLNPQIHKIGAKIHLAMLTRAHSHGADEPLSEREQALLDERQLLKEANAKRQAQATLPKPKAAKPVREPKPPKAPKAPKAAKEAKPGKAGKDHKPSRADKLVKKAENLEAAKKAAKKSAKP